MAIISKTIYQALKSLTNNRVYPLVAENGTVFPFIIYHTSMSQPVNEKDRLYGGWEYRVVVDIVDDNYDRCCELCEQALSALEALDVEYDVEISSVDERYQDDAYVKEIQVRIA